MDYITTDHSLLTTSPQPTTHYIATDYSLLTTSQLTTEYNRLVPPLPSPGGERTSFAPPASVISPRPSEWPSEAMRLILLDSTSTTTPATTTAKSIARSPRSSAGGRLSAGDRANGNRDWVWGGAERGSGGWLCGNKMRSGSARQSHRGIGLGGTGGRVACGGRTATARDMQTDVWDFEVNIRMDYCPRQDGSDSAFTDAFRPMGALL